MADKGQFEVTRSTTIAASPSQVHALLNDFKEWTKWSPWEQVDPNLERSYSGSNTSVGAVYEWRGNRKAGQGRMEITEDVPGQRVIIALDFIKPFKVSNTTQFALEPDGAGTRVTWRLVGPVTFGARIMGIFKSMDAMIGPDFEKGLRQLNDAAT